ncbi:glycosyltransferase [Brasilonema bromeliae]|uniref:Glycosyltransferase family 2 protein n=1 Tax=Brasilonema bromeliae SPC951 TaxID=385972 RepID=A0ABX1P6L0_9CYAN|nr:glycosyltransferase [Brasilonema bromeliae]NMG20024.1 glycosyltransferase family 2 protein [Brasilonema bromeliae SPC951]
MNVISRIQFPRMPETSGLYMKFDEGTSLSPCVDETKVMFHQNTIVSFNTYFHSFYEKFYGKYTELKSVYYLLALEGHFIVSLYREHHEQDERELIYKESFENCQPGEPIKILLPHSWLDEDAGRVYLEIMCLSKEGFFTEGYVATDEKPLREVSLGIITCTFKKEAYIKKTVDNLLKDNFIKCKNFKIFIVDNGKTLKEQDFYHSNVQLIPNRNLGGSGGFTRGLYEALQEDKYTHFLFMDDDIELNSESIYRLFTLYEYAKDDFAVAGGWLDLAKKHMLYEAGAFYGEKHDSLGYKAFSVNPLKRNLDLQNSTFLNSLLKEEDFDYGGFWFFSCSQEVVKKIGLLMPFFIQRDDIEFCLRIKKYAGNKIIFFPPISVWHEPSYAISKQPAWLIYYVWRNSLITSCIHSSLKYMDAIKHILRSLIIELFFFNYSYAVMLVKGFEDCMKGPAFLQSIDAETLHSTILELSKRYESQTLSCDNYLVEDFYQKPEESSWKKIISILTLNGHLLPSFLISDSQALVVSAPGHSKEWLKGFAKRKVLMFKEEKNTFYQYELNQWAGIKLLSRFLKIAMTGVIKWSFISRHWKNASKELVSIKFWQAYFGLTT